MTIKIDLPESHTVSKGPRDKSWNASVTVDVGKLSPEIVARLALHGLHQKIADAASGATTEAEASAAMNKAADAILAGEWTSRTSGDGETEQQRVERMITRAVYKQAVGGDSPEWKEFDGLDKAAQADKLDAIFAKNEAKLRPAVDDKLAALKAERDRKAGLKVELEL